MPAPDPRVSFSAGVLALERIEQARKQREDQMRKALEILADSIPDAVSDRSSLARFVRATAREGLGRDDVG